MTTIRLLKQVGNEAAGAVLQVSEDRARRLVDLTGYAERVTNEAPKPAKRKGKDD
jgi:hypothetical protein